MLLAFEYILKLNAAFNRILTSYFKEEYIYIYSHIYTLYIYI
jgi:hypothetical protein